MKLSVIIPVYNAEKYLKRCLDSVLRQTIGEKEIICVDDGSTDGSLSILQEYAERNNDFYVLRQENRFAGTARNYGLSIAKGEYIHFLDADDYILNDIYSQIYITAVKMDADYIKTRNTAFDMKSGDLIEVSAYTLKNLDIHYFNQLISLNEHPEMLLYSSVTPWCGWVKKRYIEEKKIKFNDLKCVNDRSFYANVISNTDRIVLCDYYMVAHQINNSESLVGRRSKNYECCLESYHIVENNTKKLPINIRKKLMTCELHATLGGYGILAKEQKKEYDDSLREFLEKLNWKNISAEILLCPVVNEISKKFKIELKHLFHTNIVIDSIDDLEDCLTDKENIVIYGAGNVSSALIKFIRKKNSNIKLFIVVSDMLDNPELICGVPVKKKSKEFLDNAEKIIIAVLQCVPIYLNLVNAGYKNIQAVSNAAYKELLNDIAHDVE